MDPGRPKNQSSRNQMKPVPLCPSHRSDSDHIIFSSNRHRMRTLLRSNQNPKHAKSQLVKVNTDVSSMKGDVIMLMWCHQEVTCVTQIQKFLG
jgi:hypothetical protein